MDIFQIFILLICEHVYLLISLCLLQFLSSMAHVFSPLMKFIPGHFILFDAIIHGDVLFIYFSWRLITLQYCSSFCHTLLWISHGCTCVPILNPPSHLPPHPIPQGHPSAPALSTLPRASILDWRSVSYMIIYMFQCYSLRSSTLAFSQSPKDCSIHLCLFCCVACRVIVTILGMF